MSTRLQVVMSDEELGEIRAAAERRRMNVSEWVRMVLREERDREMRGGSSLVAEPPGTYGRPRASQAPGPSSSSPSPRAHVEVDVKEELLDAVRERYRLPSRRAAIEFALRRVAVRPMSREEALAMQGVGWEGDVERTRSADPGALW
jgi:Arc/MetJ family transcription regulator